MTYKTNESKRLAIDSHLKAIASIECSLGKDSTTRERTNAKAKQQRLLNKIKEIDFLFYDSIEPDRNETADDIELKKRFNEQL